MKFIILLGSVLVGLMTYFQAIGGWENAFTTDNMGILSGIIGSILLAWAGESPLQKRFYNGRK